MDRRQIDGRKEVETGLDEVDTSSQKHRMAWGRRFLPTLPVFVLEQVSQAGEQIGSRRDRRRLSGRGTESVSQDLGRSLQDQRAGVPGTGALREVRAQHLTKRCIVSGREAGMDGYRSSFFLGGRILCRKTSGNCLKQIRRIAVPWPPNQRSTKRRLLPGRGGAW